MKNIRKSILIFCIYFGMFSSLYAKDMVTLETITVTAQKQKQGLQDVPMSVTVFSEIDLEDSNIDKISDVMTYIPNFTFENHGLSGFANPSIRGISSSLKASMVSVPIIIDGVPVTSSHRYDISLLDIEKVEVLRGPQGSLYGAGAEAGAVIVTTRKPDNKRNGKLQAVFGSDKKRQYVLNFNTPVIQDMLYIGLAGKHYEKDGYIENIKTGRTIDDRKNDSGKIYIRLTPTEHLDISLISSLYQSDDGARSSNLIYHPKIVTNNMKGYTQHHSFTNSLKIDYRFGKYKFESITTSSNDSLDFEQDFDFTEKTILHSGYPSIDRNKMAQEFRLSGEKGRLNWLFGLYGDDEKHYYHRVTEKMARGTLKHIEAKQDLTMQSLGIFAHSTYRINDKYSLTAGIRFDSVDKTIKEEAKGIDLESSYKEISPKISLNYQVNDDVITYATIAKGFNPGGFNHHNTDAEEISFGSERLVSYETGVKSYFLDKRLMLNACIYYIDIGNLHTITYTSATSFERSNNAKATSKGFEIEMKAKPTRNISLFANYGYLDMKFDEYRDAKGNYDGNTKSYAPQYNYSAGILYRNSSGCFARAAMTGYGDMYIDDANKYKRDAYNLVNMKIGYEVKNFEAYLYGNNIFDKDYSSHGCSKGRFTVYSEPREVGVQIAYIF